ncbi:MAG: cytidine deaminase [Peptococcaceae bacterium]|nr:cytidine deaminase [Peptococcaceae bacterium]
MERARQALGRAYAVYSGFRVGAACLWSSGLVTLGCNVENASYGLTVCAERVALFAGVAQGEREPLGLAVAVEGAAFAVPCGACLQVMAEWAAELPIFLTNGDGEVRVTDLRELLPMAFKIGGAVPGGSRVKGEWNGE